MSIILLLGLFMLTLAVTAMAGAYKSLSKPYVRHWAQKGNKQAKALFPLKARGEGVMIVLELIRAFSLSAGIIVLSQTVWPLVAWLLAGVFFFFGFAVLSEVYLRQIGMRLLIISGPLLLRLVDLLKPITIPLGGILDRFQAAKPSDMTKADLAKMLEDHGSAYTDMSADELRILKHALSFGDLTVRDVMTPKSVMQTVNDSDVLSPVLLDELHKSGHSRFPVMGEAGTEIVGILYLRDLVDAKGQSTIGELMHKRAYFVNENRELDHVLQAFLRTKRHMFVVVNAFAEVVGLVTIEDVVEQILGRPIIDEFDKYEDMRAVAEAQAKIVSKKRAKQEV